MPADELSSLKIDRAAAPPKRRRRRWAGVAAALLIAIAVAAGWFAWPRVEAVQTATVVTTFLSQQFVILNATGYVVAQRKAAVASKATGRLEWLGVAEGSRVKEGEVIARLDDRDVAAQLASARANVEVARASVEQALAEFRDADVALVRARDLAARGFVSQSSVDTALARYRRAEAAVAGARSAVSVAEANRSNAQVAVDYTRIRAPFDGVILSKTANVGDIVTPFSSATDSKGAVVTMADMATLEVEADVSEGSISKIAVGQPAEITLDALPDTRFRGVISRMVPTVDRTKATVMTKVRFLDPDPRILPEMSAKVSFLTRPITEAQQKPLLAVPPEAVVERAGKPVVFVVRNDMATAVAIGRGERIGEMQSVTGGLRAGDRVIVRPDPALGDGTRVKVAAK